MHQHDTTSYSVPAIVAMALALALLNIYIFYTGFIASDDSLYNSYATRIAGGTMDLPTLHHWFRYSVVLPLAALIRVLGVGESTILCLTLSYLVMLLSVTASLIARFIDGRSALWYALLLATTPIVVTLSSQLNADIPEALFLFASIAAFYRGWYHQRDAAGMFLLAGIFAGLAMLTRETAYGIGLFYALYFLRHAARHLKPFMFLALGTALMLALEMTWYVTEGESPLYRLFTITQSHGGLNAAGGEFAAGSGNISNSRIWGAPLSLLLNQEFGIVFWLGIGCAIALRGSTALSDETRRFLRYVYAAGTVYFLWLGYSGAIRPLPRYFMFDVLLVLVPIAVFVATTPRTWLKILIVLAAVGANYAGLSVDNINQRYPERVVAEFTIAADGPVITDVDTLSRARSFITLQRGEREKLMSLTESGSAPARYFAAVDDRFEGEPALAAMRDHGTLVETREPPKLMIGRIIDLFGLGGLLPDDKYWWLAYRTPAVHFYQLNE